jgi:hypothetical protein
VIEGEFWKSARKQSEQSTAQKVGKKIAKCKFTPSCLAMGNPTLPAIPTEAADLQS